MSGNVHLTIGRIPVFGVRPSIDEDLGIARAFLGEAVVFEATAFREGHDIIGVRLHLTAPDGSVTVHPMHSAATDVDRYRTEVRITQQGEWNYHVQAYADDYATWLHAAEIKLPAGLDVDVTLAIGQALFERAAGERDRPAKERTLLRATAKSLADSAIAPEDRLALAELPAVRAAVAREPIVSLSSDSRTVTLLAERAAAGYGSWYEFFPRSIGAKQLKDGSWKSGTFRTAAKRLPEVAAMGFDVVYLPPIHPIGHAFRKGPNNTLNPGPHDPGSPWAIGDATGGHDAIHPDLGTVADFRYFLAQAKKSGLEIALDLALQASPDHPWVAQHPEWFTTLPDGTIAYAENPPKKYQDIYPVNFDNDPEGIRDEILRIVRYWVGLGVTIFRVDNPHTKPVDFWQFLIGTINAESPDVVFLAEAFTRPAMMRTLAKVGFQQSYSYFTWRNTKDELEEFFTSISSETADFMRPNLFVNTPDILTEYLQFGGRAAYKIRAALAATAAPLWGVYSGFELYENIARPGAEENIDNEKYEYKPRDFAAAEASGDSLAPFITLLNTTRKAHPALQQLRNLTIQGSEDSAILAFSKFTSADTSGTGLPDGVIVVVNTDPHSVRETMIDLDLDALGLAPGTEFAVTDVVSGATWTWGDRNYVRLDSFTEPVHVLIVDYASAGHGTATGAASRR